jgi:hypothetical protein
MHAAELSELAARHGITELTFASAGKLPGRVDDDHDLFDVFEFQRAENVSPDLRSATPL